mgnify:CR=1 FL=1
MRDREKLRLRMARALADSRSDAQLLQSIEPLVSHPAQPSLSPALPASAIQSSAPPTGAAAKCRSAATMPLWMSIRHRRHHPRLHCLDVFRLRWNSHCLSLRALSNRTRYQGLSSRAARFKDVEFTLVSPWWRPLSSSTCRMQPTMPTSPRPPLPQASCHALLRA